MSHLLNPFWLTPPLPSGITGVYTPQLLFLTGTDTAGPFTGNVIGVVAGQRVVVFIPVLAGTSGAAGDPANWSVTWGGSAITPVDQVVVTAIYCTGAVYEFIAPASGTITLSLTPDAAVRAEAALVWLLNGVDPTTPHVAPADVVKNETNVTTASLPAATTLSEPGCLVLSAIAVKGGNVTALTATGDDAEFTGETGTTSFTDIEFGWAYDYVPATGSGAITWNWTTAAPYVGFSIILRPTP